MKEIKLTQGKIALVDDCDYDIVNQYKWHLQSQGYAIRYIKKTEQQEQNFEILMHRFIYTIHFGEIPDRMFVDHMDRNPLNCQISNLRLVTIQQNGQNTSKNKNNTSGFRGVSVFQYYDKRNGRHTKRTFWRGYIKTDGKVYSKCYPFSEEGKIQAAKWYDQKRKELFGKFCGELNFPDEND